MRIPCFITVMFILSCSSGNSTFPPPDTNNDTGLCDPACTGSEQCCGNVCVDTSSDPDNCGSCGFHCPEGEFCVEGTCESCGGNTCAEGEICCAEDCIDPMTSDLHCGECFNTCPEGEQCRDGHCVGTGECEDCNPPYMCCDGWCINVTQDKDNCGGCGIQCDPETSDRCAGSICMCHTEAECSGGAKCCDDGCKDVSNDANNCGECGVSCGVDQECTGGRCRCGGEICEFGEACCPGSGCTNVLTDMSNCGECEYSCGDRADRCVDGECRCGSFSECSMGFIVGECVVDIGAPPERCCSGHCEDVDEDNCQHCGHRCPAGQECLSRMNWVVWECEPYCGVPEE